MSASISPRNHDPVRERATFDPTVLPARLHFTPPQGWLNDPNGLVFANGRWQLYYQHNPHALVWGPMHWGSAVSDDLLTWHHRPIALYPSEKGTAFSGSAVTDRQNCAGFGPGALVAVFTLAGENHQSQGLAFSTDHGVTWDEYEHNPVLIAPDGVLDFRDPKVFAHTDGVWVMTLSVEKSIWFYRSNDLKTWTKSGEFVDPFARVIRAYETSDLFELPISGGLEGESHWVLTVGLQETHPCGGWGIRYWVGTFDGHVFVADHDDSVERWADIGPDFYAAQTWNENPDGRRIWIGWMNNDAYSKTTPVGVSRGVLSLPRELSLRMTDDGPVLCQHPIRELSEVSFVAGASVDACVLEADDSHTTSLGLGEAALLEITFPPANIGLFVLEVGSLGSLSYNELTGVLSVDRALWSGAPLDSPADFATHRSVSGISTMTVLIGVRTIEAFVNDGSIVLSALIDRAGPIDIHVRSSGKDPVSVVARTFPVVLSLLEHS